MPTRSASEEAFKIHDRIDYLINNAGYLSPPSPEFYQPQPQNTVGGLEELTPEETRGQFDTNIFGLLNVTHAFLPYMRAARSGIIANISSVGAWNRYPVVGLYCASKRCVSGLSESMNLELADFGILVCNVGPGYFRSNVLGHDARKQKVNLIEDYEGSAVRKGEQLMHDINGKQLGDVKKGAKVIVDVLTEAMGKPVPLRWVIGSDAYTSIRATAEEVLALLEESKELSCSTDFDNP